MSAEKDALVINNAISKKLDAAALIGLVPHRNPAQLQAIGEWYKSMNNADLSTDLEKKVSGSFGRCLSDLCKHPIDYDIELIEESTKGGIKEGRLIEVLIRKTNHDMQQLIQAFQTKGKGDLKKLFEEKTSGYVQKLFLTLLEV